MSGALALGAGGLAAEGGVAALEVLSGPVGWAILAGTVIVGGAALYHAHQQSQEKLSDTVADQPCTSCAAEADKSSETGKSPEINPEDLKNKTRSEIEKMAKEKGLLKDPKKPNRYLDPKTGKERLRIDDGHIDKTTNKPYDNPNAAVPHTHGYPPAGPKAGKIVDPLTGDPHFTLK